MSLFFNPYAELWSVQWFIAWVGNGIISGIVTGLIIGGLQWYLLQRYVDWAREWLIFSIIGWVLVDLWYGLVSIFMTPTSATFLVFVGSIIAGLLLGVMQWLVLRQYVYQAGWWIVANSLAWFISSFLFLIVVQAGIVNTLTPYELVNRVDKVVRWIIKESITAVCLVWLLGTKFRDLVEE